MAGAGRRTFTDYNLDVAFEQRGDGRTIFYPYGRFWRGYVLTDPALVAEMRQAIGKYTVASCVVGPVLAIPGCAAFAELFAVHPWWGLLCGSLPFLPYAAWWYLRMRRLARQVSSRAALSERGRPIPYAALGALALGAALAWLVVAGYDHRVAAKATGNDIRFYPDISSWVITALFFGGGSVVFVWPRKIPPVIVPQPHVKAVGWFFALLSLISMASLFLAPTPYIVITPDFLTCGGRRAAWQDISAIRLDRSPLGKEWARLSLVRSIPGARSGISTVQQPDTFSCKLTDVNADERAVYDAIDSAWRRARRVPVKPDRGGPWEWPDHDRV
jgi:hypothetical protein